MSELIIETYTDIYKNGVVDLILSIQNVEFGVPVTLNQQPDLADIVQFYQVGLGNFWIAKIEDKPIGTIALLDIGNGKGALRKMFVARAYRGKEFGIGQMLLNNLIVWAEQKNIAEIYLGTTEKFVGAQRFYEKNGFQVIQKSELPMTFPVMKVDVKFYRLFVLVHS